jgi:hypothetical protein
VAPEVLRDDLDWLLAQGFYPTTARDLAAGLHGVPAGKKAVVLTFDGSLASQFKLLEGGAVDPASAVGVLLNFAAAHPADFPARATFFVDANQPEAVRAPFGSADLASVKLQTLVSLGFDVGLMAPSTGASQEQATAASEEASAVLDAARQRLAALLPEYAPAVVALPEGQQLTIGASSTDAATTSPAPASPEPRPVAFAGAFLPSGGLAASPQIPGVDPYRIPRLPAGDSGGASWRDAIGAAEIYISAGE